MGCGTRRLTSTTIVLAIFVETTWPTFSFLVTRACSAILFLRSRNFSFAQNRQHARPRFAHRANLLQAVHLAHRHLKRETKLLLVHFSQLPAQLLVVEIANFLRLHIPYSASSR